MTSQAAWNLPSYRRQDVLVEFASLKHVRLRGIYVTLAPGFPDLWRCVLFVRKGPYAGAVLRFRMLFPEDYPFVVPIVTFDTSVFHPLIAAKEASPDDDVFVDAPKSVNARVSRHIGTFNLKADSLNWKLSSEEGSAKRPRVNVIEILIFIRSCFDDETVLNSLSTVDIVNEAAWNAWSERELDVKKEDSTWDIEMSRLKSSSIDNAELFDHFVKAVAASE